MSAIGRLVRRPAHTKPIERLKRMAEGRESSMDVVLRDEGVVANIVSKLRKAQDRYAAALVCRLWHDALTWQASKLALRTRASLPYLAVPFRHIVALDLTCIDDRLTDLDLKFCAISFGRLRWLNMGHPELVQDKISDEGLFALAERCGSLEHLSFSCLPNIGDAGMQRLSKGCTSLRSLFLQSCGNLTDGALESMCDFHNLMELHLKGEFKFTSIGLTRIGSACRRLVKVCFELGSTNIDPALRSLAEGCPKLEHVSLKFKNANIRDLVKCSSLCSLAVETDQIVPMDRAVIAIVKSNKNLRELMFVNKVAPLTDGTVVAVVLKCPMLEKLHLEAAKLTGAAILCIASCKTLRHLVLENLRSTGDGLAEISMCGNGLKYFGLISARGVGDVQLQSLMDRNRGFEYLDLQSCHDLTPIGFSAIAACRSLVSLDLSYTDIDDVSLLTIASGVYNLQQLNLIKCKSVTSMAALARFTTLESLNVDQCPFVCDDGLEVLAVSCSHLTHLSIAFTMVTDRGLGYLGGCSLLRSLRVSYCRLVKGWGLVDIAKACAGFQHVILSHRFRKSYTLEALKQQSCRVTLEMDDMALVPFGFY